MPFHPRRQPCLPLLLVLWASFWLPLWGQAQPAGSLRGTVSDSTGQGIDGAEVILNAGGQERPRHTKTAPSGSYRFEELPPGEYILIVLAEDHALKEQPVRIRPGSQQRADVRLQATRYTTETIEVRDSIRHSLGLTRLRDVEGTEIYDAKKNEVILVDETMANKATNNARQLYAKVPGLNIWESDAAGLQLGIGARGLNPNRSANFNVRQNGYDISADALGYPESYYTPPAEAVERINIVRGAASLQYGTQFGGLVNFQMKQGPKDKPIQSHVRLSGGSYGLLNTNADVGGTIGKFNYYTFAQYKRGGGWRPNSSFDMKMSYTSVGYQASRRLSIRLDYTFMNYLAQQPGGLTDREFQTDPTQSKRERNWFKVDWNLAALTLDYKLSENTRLNSRTFGLIGGRDALGFLGLITRLDPGEERDLLRADFKNVGNETRLAHFYSIGGNQAVIAGGVRLYRGHTHRRQGFANSGSGPSFHYLNPEEPGRSDFTFPGRNVAAFAENIFYLGDKFSLTPGVRYEFISTESEGSFINRQTDRAGNILVEESIPDNRTRNRGLLLFGLGATYQLKPGLELYANASQNYRSVTFSNLRVVNRNFRVDNNIQDERGYNIDLGLRGQAADFLRMDASLFYLGYNDRIGNVIKTDSALFNTFRFRTNVADSRTYGLESFFEFDLFKLLGAAPAGMQLSTFTNLTVLRSRYQSGQNTAIDGRKVEHVPSLMLKQGLSYRWRHFEAGLQYSFTGEQFTDATNTETSPNAVTGRIPSYQVVDLNLGYRWRRYSLRFNVNNLLDSRYFTRRASGYPGPGIIPADPRNFTATFELRLP